MESNLWRFFIARLYRYCRMDGCCLQGSYWTNGEVEIIIQKFYSRHHDLVITVTECLCHKWTHMCSVWRNHNPVLS